MLPALIATIYLTKNIAMFSLKKAINSNTIESPCVTSSQEVKGPCQIMPNIWKNFVNLVKDGKLPTFKHKGNLENKKTQDVSEKEMAQTEELFLNDPVNKIKQKLPYQTDNFEISYFLDKDNKTIFSITIYNNFKKSKNEALDWFKKQEIDPEKIEIVYFDKANPYSNQK